MKNRRVLLRVLLPMALILSLIIPVLVVGASVAVSPSDGCPTSYSMVDSSNLVSEMTLNTPQGNVTPMVAAGERYILGLKFDGTVIAVGRNNYGQCNVGNWTDITQVAASRDSTVGLKPDGTVVAVGDNYHGQCNTDGWADIVQVAAGMGHTVGLKDDGTVVAVGDNDDGQCDVGGWTNIVQITAGVDYTVGLKENGTVVAVGYNHSGQCDVGNWTDIVEVVAGDYHAVGLRTDGTVVAVGCGSTRACYVGDWGNITQVGAGYYHTVGVKSDGTVIAVGDNDYGKCDVGEWTDITQVTAGLDQTVGLKSDGTVVAVGDNYNGWRDVDKWNLLLNVLTIYSSDGGTVTTPGEGSYDYDNGSIVNLVAEPEEGYQFVNWTGDVSTVGNISAASTTISMHGDYSITANFEEIPLVKWALIGVFIAVVIAGMATLFVRRRRLGRMGFESKIWGFLRRPTTTFGQVKEETLSVALKYALICLLIFGLLVGIMLALLGPDQFFLFEIGNTWLPDNPLLLIAEVIGLSVAGGVLLIFIGGAWMHLWVYLLTGRKGHGYRQTLKALVYGATPMYLVGWVPLVGVLTGSIWAIVVAIIGLRELHGTTTGRAVAASLLAIGISAAVALFLLAPLALGGLVSLPIAVYAGVFLLLFWVLAYSLMGG